MAGGKDLDAVSLTCKKHLESDPARFFHVRVFRLIQDARSWINHYSPKQDDPWAVRPIGLGAQFLNGSDLVDVVLIIGDSHIRGDSTSGDVSHRTVSMKLYGE